MSSSEGECHKASGVEASKRRRACDGCRKKRARCDGPDQLNMQCSACTFQGLHCTYVWHSDRRATSKRYITSLETRIEKLDGVLRRMCPDETCYEEWIDSLSDDQGVEDHTPTPAMMFPPRYLLQPEPFERITKAIRASHSNAPSYPPGQLEEDDDPTVILASGLHTKRFFGKSSPEVLIRKALSMKNQYASRTQGPNRPILSNRREEFWTPRPWERKAEIPAPRPKYDFPEPDLAKGLIDLYFERVNLHQPLLHRPSFERSVREGLHYADEGFVDVYLLTCAIGARFSQDRRVRMEGIDSAHSAGWKWFNQVECRTSFLALPSLYEIQSHCLTIMFVQFSSGPQAVWTLVGIALSLIQDVGVHKRKATTPTVEDELWKRAFWILISIDRPVCIYFGRPLTLQDEDFDLDYPIDCDDEYWEHPDPQKRFKQPPNKPSLITAFILELRLIKILGTCIRAIYPLNKIINHLGLGSTEWRSHIIPELDSSVNNWLETLPDHLRWDPNHPDDKFFHQSAFLYALCYYTQIFIHRVYIQSPSRLISTPFPSLAICTTAARSCIGVADAQLRRGVHPPAFVQMTAFTSAVLLLFGIWESKKTAGSGLTSIAGSPDMEHVRTTLRILRRTEEAWPEAGKLWDILSGLASTSDSSVEAPSLPLSMVWNPSFSPSLTLWTPDGQSMNGKSSEEAFRQQDISMALMHGLFAGMSNGNESFLSYGTGSSSSQPVLESRQRHIPMSDLPPFELFTPSSLLDGIYNNEKSSLASTAVNPVHLHESRGGVSVTTLEQQNLGSGDAVLNHTDMTEDELDHGPIDWQAYLSNI